MFYVPLAQNVDYKNPMMQRLEDLGGRTRITVTSVFDSVEDRDGMLQSGMEQGAGESYDRLEAYLTTLVAQR